MCKHIFLRMYVDINKEELHVSYAGETGTRVKYIKYTKLHELLIVLAKI